MFVIGCPFFTILTKFAQAGFTSTKIAHFYKKTEKPLQHQTTCRCILLQKRYNNYQTWLPPILVTCTFLTMPVCTLTRFQALQLLFDVTQQKKTTKNLGNMGYFTQAPPRWKLAIFAKNVKSIVKHQSTEYYNILQKRVKLSKNFSDKIWQHAPLMDTHYIPPHFFFFLLFLAAKQQQNKSQFGKNDIYFPTYTPRKQLSLFS